MDCSKWTPKKSNCDSVLMMSPITKTPISQTNFRIKSRFQNSTNNSSLLPSHITPPSGLTKFIAKNPFEADLTNKLHISIMSPSVFSKVISPSQKNSEFTWSIDELALMQPAKIDEFPLQQMHCSDPEIEKNAQAAISKFFSENQIIPSPFEVKKTKNIKLELQNLIKLSEEIQTPIKSKDFSTLMKEKRESWTQTILSLPPELPPNVEEALKPYFNFTQDQNCESEEANSSNSSLRRKLFTDNDDSLDKSTDSNLVSVSPVQFRSPIKHNFSPPQSGMFCHGTPLRSCSQIIQRTFGTPLAYFRDSSPCDASPISNPNLDMSCQSIKYQNKSVAKLDFTRDMSIEISDEEGKENLSLKNKNLCKTLFYDAIKGDPEQDEDQHRAEETSCNDLTKMVTSVNNSTRLKYEDKENLILNNINTSNKSKFPEIVKTNLNEHYAMQQSNMLSGNYMQQVTFNSAQDTGYQTYSSSNIMSNLDSYSTSVRQKLHWNEKLMPTDDEVQLADWRENLKNVISSTPSKLKKGINNF